MKNNLILSRAYGWLNDVTENALLLFRSKAINTYIYMSKYDVCAEIEDESIIRTHLKIGENKIVTKKINKLNFYKVDKKLINGHWYVKLSDVLNSN